MSEPPRPAIGRQGLLFVATGAVLVLLSFRGLNWYGLGGGADSASETTFANLHNSVDGFGGARAAEIYFDWLSWTLLIAAIVIGVLANLRSAVSEVMRVLGFLVGAAGIGATYYALLQYSDAQAAAGAAKHNPLFNGSWGLFTVLLGFAMTAFGAVLGPTSREPIRV